MKKVFITGASGFIGGHLARQLVEAGTGVQVLLRKTSRAGHLQHQLIRIFYGELLDSGSIKVAMAGCTHVVHLAGLAKMWTRKRSDYYRVNVAGTKNILDLA